MTPDRPFTLAERYDKAVELAGLGCTVHQISVLSGVSVEQATLFWNRANAGSLEHSDGLRKTMKTNPEWLKQCVAELAKPIKDEDGA